MNKGNVLLVVLVTILLVGAVGVAAYFYGQNQSLKNVYMPALQTPTPAPQAPNYQATPVVSGTPVPTGSKATVVFEAEGSFTKAEKDELYKKVINPFLDYYMEPTSSTQKLLTLRIAKNDKASKDQYPYSAQAIFDGGGNMGFLVMKKNAGIDWWYPECLTKCVLSDAFKAKYPEIAAKVQ